MSVCSSRWALGVFFFEPPHQRELSFLQHFLPSNPFLSYRPYATKCYQKQANAINQLWQRRSKKLIWSVIGAKPRNSRKCCMHGICVVSRVCRRGLVRLPPEIRLALFSNICCVSPHWGQLTLTPNQVRLGGGLVWIFVSRDIMKKYAYI